MNTLMTSTDPIPLIHLIRHYYARVPMIVEPKYLYRLSNLNTNHFRKKMQLNAYLSCLLFYLQAFVNFRYLSDSNGTYVFRTD